MALQIEKATDVQREFFRGLREKQRNPGEVLDWYYDEKTTCLILESTTTAKKSQWRPATWSPSPRDSTASGRFWSPCGWWEKLPSRRPLYIFVHFPQIKA